MESKVKTLEAQIAAQYSVPEMQKRSYHLHSICVHDGNANSGHYYSFIFDRFNKKWRRLFSLMLLLSLDVYFIEMMDSKVTSEAQN